MCNHAMICVHTGHVWRQIIIIFISLLRESVIFQSQRLLTGSKMSCTPSIRLVIHYSFRIYLSSRLAARLWCHMWRYRHPGPRWRQCTCSSLWRQSLRWRVSAAASWLEGSCGTTEIGNNIVNHRAETKENAGKSIEYNSANVEQYGEQTWWTKIDVTVNSARARTHARTHASTNACTNARTHTHTHTEG